MNTDNPAPNPKAAASAYPAIASMPGKEDLYHRLFELMPGSLVLMDARGYILDTNPAFCRQIGYPRELLLGAHISRFSREPIEGLLLQEAARYVACLSTQSQLFQSDSNASRTLLGRALAEKSNRTLDRIYRLLGLIYPWRDVASARWAIERGDARARSSAVELLDNLLTGNLRKRLLPLLEGHLPPHPRRGQVLRH